MERGHRGVVCIRTYYNIWCGDIEELCVSGYTTIYGLETSGSRVCSGIIGELYAFIMVYYNIWSGVTKESCVYGPTTVWSGVTEGGRHRRRHNHH